MSRPTKALTFVSVALLASMCLAAPYKDEFQADKNQVEKGLKAVPLEKLIEVQKTTDEEVYLQSSNSERQLPLDMGGGGNVGGPRLPGMSDPAFGGNAGGEPRPMMPGMPGMPGGGAGVGFPR